MKDLHAVFTMFKDEFSSINDAYEALGQEIHDRGGPLPEKCRWLIKVAVSAASSHGRALETHIARARQAGASDEEIMHALLLIVQTAGFPTFMEAYSVLKKQG